MAHRHARCGVAPTFILLKASDKNHTQVRARPGSVPFLPLGVPARANTAPETVYSASATHCPPEFRQEKSVP